MRLRALVLVAAGFGCGAAASRPGSTLTGKPVPPGAASTCPVTPGSGFGPIPHVMIVYGDDMAAMVPIIRHEITLGQPEGQTVRLTRLAAGCSVRLVLENGGLCLVPVSMAGCPTSRAGVPLTAPIELRPDDEVHFGEYQLVFSDDSQKLLYLDQKRRQRTSLTGP